MTLLQTLTSVKCARVKVLSKSEDGIIKEGWGETPLSAAWVWPSSLDYGQRESRLIEFCESIAQYFIEFYGDGHPFELGIKFISESLEDLRRSHNGTYPDQEEVMFLQSLSLLLLNHYLHFSQIPINLASISLIFLVNLP